MARTFRPAVCNENEVRAAAGLTMAIGAVAFADAYFTQRSVLLRVVASAFFAELLIRVTIGLGYSPIGLVARAMTFRRPPEWVSAKPKRFAWTLGLGMTFAMTIITNSGVRGYLPRTICLVCLMSGSRVRTHRADRLRRRVDPGRFRPVAAARRTTPRRRRRPVPTPPPARAGAASTAALEATSSGSESARVAPAPDSAARTASRYTLRKLPRRSSWNSMWARRPRKRSAF